MLSLGKALPDTVDVWIDATCPPVGTPRSSGLEAEPGATVRVGPATFTVREIKRRRFGGPRFNARGEFVRPDLGDSDAISVFLDAWSDSEDDRYNTIMGPDMRPGYELCRRPRRPEGLRRAPSDPIVAPAPIREESYFGG